MEGRISGTVLLSVRTLWQGPTVASSLAAVLARESSRDHTISPNYNEAQTKWFNLALKLRADLTS